MSPSCSAAFFLHHAAGQGEKQHLGQTRSRLRICPKYCQFAKFLCGVTDCHVAPLLAMTCRRLARVRIIMPGYCRGAAENVLAPAHSYPPFACHCVLATAATPLSSACHCEPPPCNRRNPTVFCLSLRGAGRLHRDVAIRSSAAAQNGKQHFGQIRNRLRIRPKCDFFSPFSAGLRIATSLRSSQ